MYLTMVAGFFFASMTPIINTNSQALWQTQTPPEIQGRVFALRRLIAQISLPLGTLLAGVVGGVFNPGFILAVLGALLAVVCIAQLHNRQVLLADNSQALEAMAHAHRR